MNRRQFITGSIALAVGAKLFAGQKSQAVEPSFSIEVVTDNYEMAIREINSLIRNNYKGLVRVSESVMSGTFISDIAYTDNGRLINFYDENSNLSAQLKKIASVIGTKKKVVNPTLITFSTDTNAKAKYFDVFVDNKLKERIPVNENHKQLKFDTKKGELYISTISGTAQVEESSCRHKTCVEHKSISTPGTSIVCIPNKFRLAASGSTNSFIDTFTF